MPRLNAAKTFKGENYATESFAQKEAQKEAQKVSDKIGTLPEGVTSVIDSTTGNLSSELNPISVASMENTTGISDFSKLKIIGDCSVIYGANGLITLRIGPALNSSLFNDTDGISTATLTSAQLKTTETATIASAFSTVANTGSRIIAVKGDSDTFTATCGATRTTDTVKGNAVHFEGDGTCKFKVTINSGKGATTASTYELGPIKNADMTKNAHDYTNSGVTCKITNYYEEPKKASGASGYCANVSFSIALDTLFGNTTTDFKIVKIEQIQVDGTTETVAGSWTNTDTNTYMYLADTTTPGTPKSANYTLDKDTKQISGVTYLTTATTMTATATGLTNCGYPGYVTNKANCSYSGGAWFTAYNSTSTGDFETWTDVAGATMDWTGSAKNINIGKWDDPQVIVKGTNMHGSGSGATSAVSNNAIYVCNDSGQVSANPGSFSEDGRLDSTFTAADFSAVNLSAANNTDLQIFDGYIVYPNTNFSSYNKDGATAINPDYSKCLGDRYYYLKLNKAGTIMGGTVTVETDSDAAEAFAQTKPNDKWLADLKIELSNDKTNWMDIGRTATNDGIGDGFSYGTTNTISFSIPNKNYYGDGFMYARVTMTPDAGVKIKSISLS